MINLNRKSLFLAAAVVVFGLVYMAALTRTPSINPSIPQAPIANLKGKLMIASVHDFSVDGHKVILCGIAFTQPSGLEDLITTAARKAFQGKTLTCTQVGGGTPCDGNVAPRFGKAIVVQCTLDDGKDLANELIAKGYFCGNPTQSGGVYKQCAR